MGDKLLYEGKYDEAIGVLEGCYDIHSQKDFSLAIPSVALASVYGAKGDHKQEKKYLTISAIADVQSGTKEYISLWKLANLLYGEGDIERAYTYMECSMQDATFCNARYRTMEISGMLPVINSTYEAKLHEEKNSWSPYYMDIHPGGSIAGGLGLYLSSDEAPFPCQKDHG